MKLPNILGKYGEQLPFVAVVDFRGATGSQPPGWGKRQPRGCKFAKRGGYKWVSEVPALYGESCRGVKLTRLLLR